MTQTAYQLPVLEYLRRQLDGTLAVEAETHMRYPTAISQLLGFRIVAIGEAIAVEVPGDRVHGAVRGVRERDRQGRVAGSPADRIAVPYWRVRS